MSHASDSPWLRDGGASGDEASSDPGEQAQVVEALRTICTNLRHSLEENGDDGTATVLGVSSPRAGNGKSLGVVGWIDLDGFVKVGADASK